MALSASAFSTADEAAIQRTVDLNEAGISLVTTGGVASEDIAQIYELDEISRQLINGAYKCVRLLAHSEEQ